MTHTSLFPEHAVLETGRSEAQAIRLAHQLHAVDLQVLATDAERRSVISRLRREGIADAMQLLLLTEDEVMRWPHVGPMFLAILRGMHEEVVASPESVIVNWRNNHRLLVLPDDLAIDADEDDFFGTPMSTDSTLAESAPAQHTATSLLEKCLVAAIRLMEHRTPEGAILRDYFIEGRTVDTIVSQYHLASHSTLYRIIDRHFSTPLLRGYQVKGIQFSDTLHRHIKTLRTELLYAPLTALDDLQRVTPSRFLRFLGLALLSQTTAETYWGGDIIVREGDVSRCRRIQRDVLSALQFKVVGVRENAIRRMIQSRDTASHGAGTTFLRTLLRQHPFVEAHKAGYRLAYERLSYECSRMARIVYDAHEPVSIDALLVAYERRYLERPRNVSLSHVRTHFPQVHSVRRGVWEWK